MSDIEFTKELFQDLRVIFSPEEMDRELYIMFVAVACPKCPPRKVSVSVENYTPLQDAVAFIHRRLIDQEFPCDFDIAYQDVMPII